MSDSQTKILGYAVAATLVVGIVLALVPLFGSLRPSAKADAVYGQGQFPASEFDDLMPGEVRLVQSGLGLFFIVVPTEEIMLDLDSAARYAAYRDYNTYDDQLEVFVLWAVPPKRKGPACTVLHLEKDPSSEGIAQFGGFFDPCSGAQFDYAGRVSTATSLNNVRNLKRPEYERIAADLYQLTNLDYLRRNDR